MGVIGSKNNLHLSEELIFDILLRLPVKSLLRFRSVCKEWNSIISQSYFINEHYHYKNNPTQLLVYWHGGIRSNYDPPLYDKNVDAFYLFPKETLDSDTESSPYHPSLPGKIFALRGPCNGIFCVILWNNEMILWNPATRKVRPLPCDYILDHIKNLRIGFGLDPLTNDEFKIVLIQEDCKSKHFAMCTTSNEEWTLRRDDIIFDEDGFLPPRSIRYPRCDRTFTNGYYYWRKFNTRTNAHLILAFDMHNEVFEEITIPETIKIGGALDSYNGSLAIFSYEERFDREHVDIWVLGEQKCWTKILSVNCLPSEFEDEFFPLGLWEGSEIFAQGGDFWLSIFNLESQETREVVVEEIEECGSGDVVFPLRYKESLVSVKGKDGKRDYDTQSMRSWNDLPYQGKSCCRTQYSLNGFL